MRRADDFSEPDFDPDDDGGDYDDVGSEPTLRVADERAKQGDATGALYQLFELLHRHPTDVETLRLTAALMQRLGVDAEAEKFALAAEDPTDPQALYDLGYLFVESGFPGIAVGYLRLCLTQDPSHPLVRYELAYALFCNGQYAEALELLGALDDEEALSGTEAFAASLLRVQCAVYLRQLDEAQASFDKIDVRDADSEGEAQMDAVAALLARARRFEDRGDLGPRDWHVIENGGAVLHVERDSRTMYLPVEVGVDYVAAMLRRLERFLSLADAPKDAIQYIGNEMQPVALALAKRLSATVLSIDDPIGESTLILMREPNRALPHLGELRSRDDGADLFSLFLDPRRDYPIAPEIVGQFAAEMRLPWAEGDLRDADALASEIVRAMEAISQDGADLDLIEGYYRPLRDTLVFANYDRHPVRRVFTAQRAGGFASARRA